MTFTVKTKIFDTDSAGVRFCRYFPGDEISDAEAERLVGVTDPEPAAKSPDRMSLAELVAVCKAESISTAGCNTRSEYRKKIEAGREAVANANER